MAMTDLENILIGRGRKSAMGTLDPWSMPEWAPSVEAIRTKGQLGLEDLYGQIGKTGLRGPAVASLLSKGYDKTMDNILDFANTMASKVGPAYVDQGISAETGGLARAERAQMRAEENYKWQKARQDAKEAQRRQEIGGGMTKLSSPYGQGGGGCCFMFIMGEGKIIDQVQKFKYEWFGYNSHVANGYRWMSLKLMPVIRKSPFVKKLIKFFITEPLSKFAVHYYNDDPRGYLYAPVGIFWCLMWSMIGRIVSYNSDRYQTMVKELGI